MEKMPPVDVPPPFRARMPLVTLTVPVLLKAMLFTLLVVPAPETFQTPELLMAGAALAFSEKSPPAVTL